MLQDTTTSRRSLLGMTGKGVLSLAAVGILANNSAMAAMGAKGKGKKMDGGAGDVAILNTALGLEHEAINAYQIGAESGLLPQSALDVAVKFQSQHKDHRDALLGAIKQLGGKAVDEKSRDEYVASLNAASIKSATDILTLAARLERGAANAYIGVIPSFKNTAFAQVCAKLAADEATHVMFLDNALGRAIPNKGFQFG